MKVYIHGNCQGPALVKLMREACLDDFHVSSRGCYQIDIHEDEEKYKKDIREADIVIGQFIHNEYRGTDWLSTSWILDNMKSSSTYIPISTIYHRGQLPQLFTMSNMLGGVHSYHDAHSLYYFIQGKDAEEFVDDSSSPDFLPANFVCSEAYRSTMELVYRESETEGVVHVSDLILPGLATGQPLYTIDHPNRHVLAGFANRILKRIGSLEHIDLAGPEPLDAIIIAPYRSTLLALGHGGASIAFDRIRHEGIWIDRLTFYRYVFDRYRSYGGDQVRRAVAGNRAVRTYLERYSAATETDQNRSTTDFIRVLYQTLCHREPAPSEVGVHLANVERYGLQAVIAGFVARESEFARVHDFVPALSDG